jgi:putative ABC transport system permease protein
MSQIFHTTLSLFTLAAKRLWNLRLLMLALMLGLIAAVGIMSSVPMYADATQNRLLQGELTETGTHRPPFAFLWRYVGVWSGNITLDEYAPVDAYLREQAPGVIGLPAQQIVRHVSSDKLRLFASGETNFDDNAPLLWANAGFITDLVDHIRLAEGAFPAGDSSTIQALVTQATADRLGLQIGETYTLFGQGRDGAQIPLTISGIWTPIDPADPFWFYTPDSFNETILTTEAAFRQQIAPLLDKPVSTAVWYLVLDGRTVRPATVSRLLNNVSTAESRVTALLNNTELEISPVAALQNYGSSADVLTLTLTVFSLPVVGLTLYFINLIAGMAVRRSRSEIAILRSRGTTRGQIIVIYLLEGLLLGGLGLAIGLLGGSWIAQMMGRTRTFLDTAVFSSQSFDDLVTTISPNALIYAGLAVLLTLLALLLPAYRSSRHTIVTLRTRQARDLQKPIWQRYFLDVLLLIPPLYGWYQLDQQGKLTISGSGNDPFANPLLFLVPVLFSFSLGLFAIRFFPWVMGTLAWATRRLPSTTLLITLRQLARSAGQYTGSLLLLTLTLSLATFTASMAVTLDDHLSDQAYYKVGADLNLVELGENTEKPQQPPREGQPQPQPQNQEEDEDEPKWLFLPVTDHLDVDGVEHAARVGEYKAISSVSGRQRQGRILGIDRIDFAKVAFFRRDFASNESLGGVLNRLAVSRDYLLVSHDFMTQNGLNVGDPLRLNVEAAGEFTDIEFIIAAPLDYFPTMYPQDGPFFVAQLDYLHESMGGQFPYNVWLEIDESVPDTAVTQGVRDLGLLVVSASSAQETINAEQQRPERQGLFGLLSVGFGAAAILTVLGFLVFAIVSFKRRFIELGMLRAIGLSVGQMAIFLAGEQAALILTGMGLGTGLGVWASTIFIPYFQVGSDKTALVPPFVVQIAWEQIGAIYAIFGAMFIVVVAILIGLLIRMKVFEAVKLGETV